MALDKVQVWFSIELKFNSFELDSEVGRLVFFCFYLTKDGSFTQGFILNRFLNILQFMQSLSMSSILFRFKTLRHLLDSLTYKQVLMQQIKFLM